ADDNANKITNINNSNNNQTNNNQNSNNNNNDNNSNDNYINGNDVYGDTSFMSPGVPPSTQDILSQQQIHTDSIEQLYITKIKELQLQLQDVRNKNQHLINENTSLKHVSHESKAEIQSSSLRIQSDPNININLSSSDNGNNTDVDNEEKYDVNINNKNTNIDNNINTSTISEKMRPTSQKAFDDIEEGRYHVNRSNNNIDSNTEISTKSNEKMRPTSQKAFDFDFEESHITNDHININNSNVCEIRKVLKHKEKKGIRYYLIWWKGYSREEATWEPATSIHSREALEKYYRAEQRKYMEDDDYIDNSDEEPADSQYKLAIEKARLQSKLTKNNIKQANDNHISSNNTKSEVTSKLENNINNNIKKLKHHHDDDDDDDDPSDDSDDSDNEVSYSRERNNPLEYMIPHLELREKLYPISKNENQYLYKERYSLLDSDWRMSEIYRFGFLTEFNPYLYSSLFRRYYDSLRKSRGLEPIWYPNIRVGSITEEKLPKLIMTYVEADTIIKGRKVKGDIDLTERSVTLNVLPVPLRKHPNGWSYYKSIHNPPSFTKLAMEYIDNEIIELETKRRDALRHLKAKRAASIYNETVPHLEVDNDDIVSNNTNSSITPNISLKQEFVKKELKRDDLLGQSTAEQNDIFKFVLGELSIDTRAAVILELNKRKYTSEDNRFADKSILKKPPAPKEPFSGRDITQAPQILNYILVNIAKYDFNVSESFSFIETALCNDALIWFNHQYSDIFSQPRHLQLYRFVMLFKQQYMNQAMATIYENQLRRCKLLQENVHSVDSHFNLFMKIAGNWRACDYTILDEKLVHIYFSNLPEYTQRTLGVAALTTCKSVSEMYNTVKQTAIMVTKQQRVINRDVVNINSLHTSDTHNNYHGYTNDQYDNNVNDNDYNYDNSYDTDSNDSDEEEIHTSVDEQYNYVYPSDNDEYFNHYNISIDDIYFNSNNISKDYYSRDWNCFHCGDRGHRAGWFCPLVRQQKSQTGRGAQAYAEYQKKYAKEIKPYNIDAIVKREKEFWQKKGKDIQELVHAYNKKLLSTNNNINNNNDKRSIKSKSNNNNSFSKKVQVINKTTNLRDAIKANRDRLKKKNVTDLSNDNDDINNNDDDVQEVVSNHLYVSDDETSDYIYSDAFSDSTSTNDIYMNNINDNINITNNNNELAIIQQLALEEKQYAHPLLVQVELNGIIQNVLLDHGATRNLVRKSTLDKYYKNIYHEYLSNKCALISSSGTTMPILSRVKLTVRIGESEYQDALFYVVSDTPSKDIITSFVLGRTFLNMSGLCYDYKHDLLYDKNNKHKQYMKILNGKIITKEQGERKSEIVPLCSYVTNNNNINTNEDYTLRDKEKVPQDDKKDDNNKSLNIINTNNKKKTLAHKLKVKQRYDNIKQKHNNIKLKHDNIVKSVTDYLNSDKCSSFTNDMKNIIINHISSNIYDYDTVEEQKYNIYTTFYHMNITNNDNQRDEKKARVRAYMKVYNDTKDNTNENDIVFDQVLKMLNEKEDVYEEDDSIMKNINDINELSAPNKQDDTKEILQQKYNKVDEIIKTLTHLNDNQRNELKNVINEYIDVYSLAGENFKPTDIVQHEIHLEPDTKPFHQRLRVYSPALQDIINTEVNKMIQDKIIVKSNSPFASNLLLVRKPDPSSPGGIKNRVCVNFIQLNKLTIKDRYPLPNQEDIFRQIGEAKFFTTMDLMSGFWQIAIKPEHRHKTAFITTRGLYEFLVMPFGLCNAPSTFQRMMDKIILPEFRSFIQTYIDDIILFSKTFHDHIKHLKILHNILRANKLTVKLSKCHFSQTSVKFLGHVISEGEIKPNPEKIEAIKQWKQPNDVSAVRSFLGAVGWYRKFIPRFSEIAIPLINLTKKNTKYIFDNECIKSFNILRDALTKTPVLKQADPTKNYILQTDASNLALGAVLLQKDDNNEIHPIAYASKTLNAAQQNYSASEKECLALIWALEHFNTYCEGHEYTCLTDHRALTYLISNKESNNQRITRWILRLQPYNLKVEYIKGTNNNTADLLSRPHMMINNNTIHVNDDHIHNNDNNERIYINGARTKKTNKRRSTRAKKQLAVYDVEAIVDKRKIHKNSNEYEYLVKWKNYDDSQNTWEPLSHLTDSINLVLEYENKHHNKNANKNNDENISESTEFECEECNIIYKSEHEYYIHKYKEHNILLPTLDSDMGLINEIDDTLMKSYQEKDDTLKYIYDSDLGNNLNNIKSSREKKDLLNHEFFKNENGVLYCINSSSSKNKLRVVLPKSLRRKLISEVHDGMMSAHPGISHTCNKISEIAWWPHWRSDVIRYILDCDKCQRAKRKQMINQLPRPVSVPSRPFQHIGIDVVGPFPTSQNGNVYILTVVDHFTRWAEAIPMPEQTTKYIANVVIKHIICRHGLFDTMTSDNGSVFVSELANYIYKELGIKRFRTTPHHPQSNGIPERLNGTLKQMLKVWCNEEQNNWDEYLPYVMFAYNTSYHTLLQETPFFLQHGRDPKLLSDIIVNKSNDIYDDVHGYGQELVDKLKSVYKRIQDIYNDINTKRKAILDNIKEQEYNIGDKVLLYDPTTKVGLSRKLTIRWKGPYTIIQKRNSINYVINIDGKMSLVNKHRLRPYVQITNEESRYDNDIVLLQEEVNRISELEIDLRSQKQYKQQQLEIAKANKEVNSNSNSEVNSNNDNDDSIVVNQEALDENESDIQANMYMIELKW
ncbi:MAG: DDE-type integrase/transposase/recombinase, partial [Bacteroidetes bacterium]|nr:DDE-type integrase/transposase/recombinase [Bacteroidota bacterium]